MDCEAAQRLSAAIPRAPRTEAITWARERVRAMRASHKLPELHAHYAHLLGWLAGVRWSGVIDTPDHDALFAEAAEVVREWQAATAG